MFFIFGLLLAAGESRANLDLLCDKLKIEGCEARQYSRSSNVSRPTEQSSYSSNPAAIPTDKGIGVETILDDGDFNFGLVTGTGKVGAAIGPNSIDDSFFGNMAFEGDADYEARLVARKKYKSQKTVVAAGYNLYGNGKSRKPVKLNLGVMGRYNKATGNFKPGGGLSVQLGPLSVGLAKYKDEFHFRSENIVYFYESTITTFGLKIPYIALDYSYAKNVFEGIDLETRVSILSTTAFWKKWMLTYAWRTEDSYRPEMDFDTNTFTYVQEKKTNFLGIQYAINKRVIIGAFHNYYLLQDWSLGLTVFL